MNFIEFLGFIISLAALTFLFFKRFFEQRRRRLHPEQFEKEEEMQQEHLREFLHSLDIDMQDSGQFNPPPPPHVIPPLPPYSKKTIPQKSHRGSNEQSRSKREQYRSNAPLEKRKVKSKDSFYESFDERLLSKDFRTSSTTAYDVVKFEQTPRIQKMVTRLPSLKEMVVLKEIIGPPKSLRDPHEFG